MKKNVVPIAFAFDNNLMMPACIAISSLLMNAKESTFYDIFILHSVRDNLRRDELDKLPQYFKQCRLTYREVDDSFEKSFEIRGITVSTYYRLLIPELIPEYDSIVYSDVDVIFRSDLSDLYLSTDLTDCYIAGVNSMAHTGGYHDYYANELKINPEEIFYAGNVIFNAKKIREDHLVDKFKSLAQHNYKFQDMDVINIACQGKIKSLAPEFCVTTVFSEFFAKNKEVLLSLWKESDLLRAKEQGIVHYNGQKPWKGFCINFDIWWEYYRKSPYYNEKFYFDFFNDKLNELDSLTLWKRIKILVRYFTAGRQ